MSLNLIPRLKGTGSRRAVDKVAELESVNSDLRHDMAKVMNRQAAADDFFAILMNDVVTTNAALEQERQRRELAETELAQAEAAVELRDQTIAALERRLAVVSLAESAATKTQEMSIAEIRRHCVKPVPLHQAPFATVDPGRIPPTWTRGDDNDTQPLPAA
ncbi:hypothetical protein [Streptomyces sp. enrichment culture]|uniref:hypothetical protein n=1 Tax=Streptomyces sp. enrichment culture TaxID=1795815 RepID=UPI003F54A7BB